MSYQFYGKRRTATPVSNRTRAVAHRHIPYHPSVQHSITVTMEEKVESLTILPLSQPEPQKSQEKPLTRPQKRKLRKRNLIELQAKQPHTGLLEKVFLPLQILSQFLVFFTQMLQLPLQLFIFHTGFCAVFQVRLYL